jgi:hypothetical protein
VPLSIYVFTLSNSYTYFSQQPPPFMTAISLNMVALTHCYPIFLLVTLHLPLEKPLWSSFICSLLPSFNRLTLPIIRLPVLRFLMPPTPILVNCSLPIGPFSGTLLVCLAWSYVQGDVAILIALFREWYCLFDWIDRLRELPMVG